MGVLHSISPLNPNQTPLLAHRNIGELLAFAVQAVLSCIFEVKLQAAAQTKSPRTVLCAENSGFVTSLCLRPWKNTSRHRPMPECMHASPSEVENKLNKQAAGCLLCSQRREKYPTHKPIPAVPCAASAAIYVIQDALPICLLLCCLGTARQGLLCSLAACHPRQRPCMAMPPFPAIPLTSCALEASSFMRSSSCTGSLQGRSKQSL